jgi:hypothetical protein
VLKCNLLFIGNTPTHCNVCFYSKVLEQVNCFKCHGYSIRYKNEEDISEKILNYIRAMGIMNQIFKPNLVQMYTRIRVYRILA